MQNLTTNPLPRVVLVHGLFMGRPVMLALARQLRLAGFDADCFAYNTVTGTLEDAGAQLIKMLITDARPVVLVGHSLGGLVSLAAAQHLPAAKLAGVILLGSPYQGATAAQVLHKITGGARSRIAPALTRWAELESKPTVRAPVFTLAGTLPSGLGRIVCGFREPNDGTVTVAETHYPGATTVLLPVSHTGMLFSAPVARQVTAWLQSIIA